MRNCSLTAPYLFELMILYMSVMQALTSLYFRFPLEHNCMRIQLYLPELRPVSCVNIAQKICFSFDTHVWLYCYYSYQYRLSACTDAGI